ncbi:ABC transporter permease [Limibaculum sp. M0105]|uniref:ABC transporter permease n=1 Tax=Thermohalobaculum xanthum TaxID=2753746 RepID=A0A8J7MAI3_9RHOB|nr:ABC transporter permease [Thermohalobaculum xanthum]MBK0401290.1 ABC transporter permease [Thermohalobaculum xanthum]
MSGLPPYASTGERVWYYSFRVICGLIFIFLITPILVVLPLSFNAQPYFSFTNEMLTFQEGAFSTRWYWDILENGMANPSATEGWWADVWQNAQWVRAVKNSFFIGIFATLIATALGTLAAIGLSRSEMPFSKVIMSILISPMIIPLVITGASMFSFFSLDFNPANWVVEGDQPPEDRWQLAFTYGGLILAHAALGTPFVIITVTATLASFDQSLVRAAQSMGADPVRTFFKVQMPLILPGVISGALFAFITSFDEVVVVLQMATAEQRTIPRQMFSGIREQISPTILAVATILVIISIALLATVEMLRRRSEKLRGMSPQ